jgi:ribosomal protein S27AE
MEIIRYLQKKKVIDNFMELIKIIINDYMNYPNYFHFINIQNIYNILFNKEIEVEEDKDLELINLEGTILLSYDDGETRDLKGCFRNSIKGIYDNLSKEKKIYIFKNKSIFDCYHGKTIPVINRLEDIINEEDNNLKRVKFYVIEKEKTKEKIKSKDIICPQCKESIFMNIKDYKINLFDCINRHKINNIFLDEY